MHLLRKFKFKLVTTAGFCCIQLVINAQPIEIDFNSIPKSGTVLMYTHQDDDLIWMNPFWSKTETFINAAMPVTPRFKQIIHNQQVYMDNHDYDIHFESNWINPWGEITNEEYQYYYWNRYPSYQYVGIDHIIAKWENDETEIAFQEKNRIKAKIEQFIASPDVSRIITHNNWGEYGHPQHKAVNKAVRELAVKYRKDVWMLGCDNGNFIDIQVPSGMTFTYGTFDGPLFDAIREMYKYPNNWWTWSDTETPTGDHKFVEVVEDGIDKSGLLTGESVATPGSYPFEPGAYIFDGQDDYMTLPGNNHTSFTIAMYIRPDQIRSMDISSMAEYPLSELYDRSFHLGSDGKVSAKIYDGQWRTLTSTETLQAGVISHILITGNGSSFKLYVDGVLQNSVSTGEAIDIYSSPEFVMGQDRITGSFFKGQISDVRLYNYAMSESDIYALFGNPSHTTYTITGLAGTGGAISPSGSVIINEGTSKTFTITASNGYVISDVKVDNVSQGAIVSYSFSNVTADHTIAATFSPIPSHTITSSAGAGGTLDPSGPVDVARGSSKTFTITAGTGFEIDDVLIDNVSMGALYTYTFNNVIANHTISATFKAIPIHTITGTAGIGGSIDPSGPVTVNHGASLTFSIAAQGGYEVGNVLVDDIPVGAVSSYTFNNVSDNHTISVTFTGVPNHTILSESGTGGTVNPSGAVLVNHGTSKTFSITASNGYQIADVLADSISVGTVSSYSFYNVTGDHTISASFSAIATFTISSSAGSGGTIDPEGSFALNQGASASYTITADEGYQISDVKVDNVSVGSMSSYTFYEVNQNHVITASFQSLPKHPKPAYSIDFVNEQTNQVVPATDEYSYYSNMYNAVSGNGSKLTLTTGKDVYFRTKASPGYLTSDVQLMRVAARPSSPSVSIDYANEKTAGTISSSVVYSTGSNYNSAVEGNGSKLSLTPGQNLYLWVKSTAIAFRSEATLLIVPNRPAKPAVAIDYVYEKTSSVSTGMEYSYNASMVPSTTGTNTAVTLAPGTSIYFRMKSTSTSFVSAVQNLTVSQRPETPSYQINYLNAETDKQVPSSEEYSTFSDMAEATDGNNKKIAITPGVDLYFRKKADSDHFASLIHHLKVTEQPEAPEVTIDFAKEKTMEIIPSTVEYAVVPSFANAVNGNGSKLGVQPGQDLYFRFKATISSFRSAVNHLTVPNRPETPGIAVDYARELTSPVAVGLEYTADVAAPFLSGEDKALRAIPGTNLHIRRKVTASSFASAVQQIILPERPASPQYSVDYSAEATVEALPPTHEYSYHADMTETVSGMGNRIVLEPGKDLYIRSKSGDAYFASSARHLIVPARAAAPSFTIDYVFACTSQTADTNVSYTPDSTFGSPVNGSGIHVPLLPGQDMFFRYNSDYAHFTSEIQHLVVPKVPSAPSISIDFANETTAEVIPPSMSVASSSDFINAIRGSYLPWPVSPGTNLFLRTEVTDSSFVSEIQHLVVKPRPDAPLLSINFIAETTAEPVDTILEYAKQKSFAAATKGNGEPLQLIPGETLYFRVRRSDTSFYGHSFLLQAAERPLIENLEGDTIAAASYRIKVILPENVGVCSLADLSITNGSVQNFQGGNIFSIFPAEIGDVKVAIPPNAFDSASFSSNILTVYFKGVETGHHVIDPETILVYPVPSRDGFLNLQVDIASHYRIELLSPDGIILRRMEFFDAGLHTLDLRNYRGWFLLRISSGNKQSIRKIILN